jgi:hypothetical protein
MQLVSPIRFSTSLLVLLALPMLQSCTSLGFLGGQSDMPNTGVRASQADEVVEYVHIFEPEAPQTPESASGLLALALDRLAGWALGALRDAAVARLDKLAGEFAGGFEVERSAHSAQPPTGELAWRSVRGVRFVVQESPDGTPDWATTLRRVGLSPALEPYFAALLLDGDKENQRESEYETCAFGNSWWTLEGRTTWVQFATMEVRWLTESSQDGLVFRVKDPSLTIWASEARLLNWPRHKASAIKELQAQLSTLEQRLAVLSTAAPDPSRPDAVATEILDVKSALRTTKTALDGLRRSGSTKPADAEGVAKLLGGLFLRDHGLHVAVQVGFSGIRDQRPLELGEVSWAFEGIWPMDTALSENNELLPAFVSSSVGYASRWIPHGEYQTVGLKVRESSDVEAWILAARDQVAGVEWEDLADKPRTGRGREPESAESSVVRSQLSPVAPRVAR